MTMYVYDYVCIWLCMYMTMYVYDYVCLWLCVQMTMYVYDYVCIWLCMYMTMYVYNYVCKSRFIKCRTYVTHYKCAASWRYRDHFSMQHDYIYIWRLDGVIYISAPQSALRRACMQCCCAEGSEEAVFPERAELQPVLLLSPQSLQKECMCVCVCVCVGVCVPQSAEGCEEAASRCVLFKARCTAAAEYMTLLKINLNPKP